VKILVTGGAGYIGSHTTLQLLEAGMQVVVLDNLCNSSVESLHRVAKLAGRAPVFLQGDVRDRALLDRLFAEHSIQSVLHFAGLKAVGESVQQPLRYYDNNMHGSQVLLEAMSHAGVFGLVFSSSATVYGDPAQMPIAETCPVGQPTNPYGRSKLMVEDMLRDLATADPRWRIATLRYFNPVGAHESGRIGEDPNGISQKVWRHRHVFCQPRQSRARLGLASHSRLAANDARRLALAAAKPQRLPLRLQAGKVVT
jgi:UDP-glucose 4-epimerase